MVDWNKPIRIKGFSYKVEFLKRVKHPSCPIAVLVSYSDTDQQVLMYAENGKFLSAGGPSSNDIENIPEEKFAWVNVYPDGPTGTMIYTTRKEADEMASPDRIGRTKIKYETRWDE